MYVYFDENGVLKEIITERPFRVGDSKRNKIYIYYAGEHTITQGLIKYTLPWNGSSYPSTAEMVFFDAQNNWLVGKELPTEPARNLEYFSYEHTYTDGLGRTHLGYKFYEITVPDEVLNSFTTNDTPVPNENNLIVARIRFKITDDEDPSESDYDTLGALAFSVEANIGILTDSSINVSQYNYLMRYIGELADIIYFQSVTANPDEVPTEDLITIEINGVTYSITEFRKFSQNDKFGDVIDEFLEQDAPPFTANRQANLICEETGVFVHLKGYQSGADTYIEVYIFGSDIAHLICKNPNSTVMNYTMEYVIERRYGATDIYTLDDAFEEIASINSKIPRNASSDNLLVDTALFNGLKAIVDKLGYNSSTTWFTPTNMFRFINNDVVLGKDKTYIDNNGTRFLLYDFLINSFASINQKIPSDASSSNKMATASDINAINEKIPSTASSSNKLADESYVNDQINSISAYYITKNAQGDAFATVSELTGATTYYSGGVVRIPTRNDYAIVLSDANHDNATTRYSYQGSQWEYQYTVNESPMTQPQLNALNSGITSAKVSTYDNAVANALTLAKIYDVTWKTDIDITTAKIVPDLFANVEAYPIRVGFTTTSNKNYLCEVTPYTQGSNTYYNVLFRDLGNPDANSTFLNYVSSEITTNTLSSYLNSSTKFNTNKSFLGKNYYECKTDQTIGSLITNFLATTLNKYTIQANVWNEFNVFINMNNSDIDGYYTMRFRVPQAQNYATADVMFIKDTFGEKTDEGIYVGFSSKDNLIYIDTETITSIYALNKKMYLTTKDELNKAYFNMGAFDEIGYEGSVYYLSKITKSVNGKELNWTSQGNNVYTTTDLANVVRKPSSNSTIAKLGAPVPTIAWDDFGVDTIGIAMSTTGEIKIRVLGSLMSRDWQLQYAIDSNGSQSNEIKIIGIDINNPLDYVAQLEKQFGELSKDITDTTLYKISGVADTLALPKKSQVEIVKIEGNSVIVNHFDNQFKGGYYYSIDGSYIETTSQYCSNSLIKVKPNTTYYASRSISIREYNNSQAYLNVIEDDVKQFTTSANCYYIGINFGGDNSSFKLTDGTITDADTTELESCGVNLWDEQWEVGSINASGEYTTNVHYLRSKNFIPVLSNTTYYFNCGTAYSRNGLKVVTYDANYNIISNTWIFSNVTTTSGTFTTDTNTKYIKFSYGDWSDTATVTYNHDICINYSNASINGNYYPYTHDSVNVGSDVLRSAGSVRDSKVADGGITRRIGVVDLDSLNWSYNSNLQAFYVDINGVKGAPSDSSDLYNAICSRYEKSYINNVVSYHTKDKIFAINNAGTLYIYDTSYTDAASFKTAMSGVMLYYELATPTTEQGTPFSSNALAVEMYGAEWQNGTIPLQVTKNYDISIKDQVLTNVEVDKKQSEQIREQQENLVAETTRSIADNHKSLYHKGAFDTETVVDGLTTITRQTKYTDLSSLEWTYSSTYSVWRALLDVENKGVLVCDKYAYKDVDPNDLSVNEISSHWSWWGGNAAIFVNNGSSTEKPSGYLQSKELATPYAEQVITDQPLNTLDQTGSQWLREEWLKTLNLLKDSSNITLSESGKYFDVDFVNGQTYTFKINGGTNTRQYALYIYDDTTYIQTITSAISVNETITFTCNVNGGIRLYVYCNNVNNANFMLNIGSHPYPYQEYNGKILHQKDIEGKQDSLTTSNVLDGTVVKVIGFDSQGNLKKDVPSGGGGSSTCYHYHIVGILTLSGWTGMNRLDFDFYSTTDLNIEPSGQAITYADLNTMLTGQTFACNGFLASASNNKFFTNYISFVASGALITGNDYQGTSKMFSDTNNDIAWLISKKTL